MFRQVIAEVATAEVSRRAQLAVRAQAQRQDYDESMPQPGEDPELRDIIEPLLPHGASLRPTDDVIRDVLQRARTHITSENKRKNLLGRGFEDVLAGITRRLTGTPPSALGTQTSIEEIRGFRAPREGDKTEKVDMWVERPGGTRVLVSAKWSVRADREKQMRGDFLTYVDCNEIREPFEYVWVTNEFDPARLVANATNTEGNRFLFDAVIHLCPDALRIVHDLNRPEALPRTLAQLNDALNDERIIGLDAWLRGLSS
jgi:hypothetical protein